jgi:hypothetical protein
MDAVGDITEKYNGYGQEAVERDLNLICDCPCIVDICGEKKN